MPMMLDCITTRFLPTTRTPAPMIRASLMMISSASQRGKSRSMISSTARRMTKSLSASGSIILPRSETWSRSLASQPSRKSERIARNSRKPAIRRAETESINSSHPMNGTMMMREAEMKFGIVRILRTEKSSIVVITPCHRV